ncbi:MAG: ABC transporter permease [Candidatus Hydrogenedentes bacterium]|nr:ABC transporter permease [Candidatus Hydrogenedentota bacterium]
MPVLRHIINYLGLAAALALLVAFFGSRSEHFLSQGNFLSLANQIPDALLIATGMTFVLIIGGIDLSVGSVMALCGAVLGTAIVVWGWPVYLAIPLALATGAACGLINGLIVVRWRLPSFIVTLGMLEAARGAAYLVTNSQTLYIGRPVDQLTGITAGGLTLLFFVAIAVVLLAQGALSMTTWGRGLFALGASEETARLSGLPVNRLKVVVFMLSGAAAGLASVVLCARLSSADPNMGSGYELNAIAAVVVGGTSLLGGRGSVINTFFGVLIIAVLGSGLVQIDVDDPVKRVVTGAVIVVAVILDYYRGRWSQARR